MNYSFLLDNSLILKEIGRHLLLRHLYSCVLVSKEWNQKFIPFLWRHIDFKWNIDKNSLLLHHHHVFTISSLEEFFITTPVVSSMFPNLQRIIKGTLYDDIYIKPYEAHSLELLSQAVRLESLFLCFSQDHIEGQIFKLPSILECLTNLRVLDLTLHSIPLELLKQIICHSTRCTIFHVTTFLEDDEDLSPARIEEFNTSIGNLTDIRFQDLCIRILGLNDDIDIAVPMLEHSPQVESFYLFSPYTFDTLQHLSSILLEDKSRRPLTFLGIEEPQELNQPNYWNTIRVLFQSIAKGHCDNFIAKGSMDSNNRSSTTTHFTQTSPNRMPHSLSRCSFDKAILENITTYFSDTLTSLELVSISAHTLIILLSQLPSLHTLCARSGQTIHPIFKDFEDINDITWPCVRLKSLDLFLAGIDPISLSNHGVMTCLFKQIGRLQKLEELTLGSSFKLLGDSCQMKNAINTNTNTGGYLYLLKDLKRLYKMDLKGYIGSECEFSVEDITWMVENWTSLSQVIVYGFAVKSYQLPLILDVTKQNDIIFDLHPLLKKYAPIYF